MVLHSAGALVWRHAEDGVEVLLGHFGGPYWARRDAGAWGIPKGLIEPGETPEQAARRELREELGTLPAGTLVPLAEIRQKGGKRVTAFALESEFDPAALASNGFALEWPRGSGRLQTFPELDRVAWFGMAAARAMILPSQAPLLDALDAMLAG